MASQNIAQNIARNSYLDYEPPVERRDSGFFLRPAADKPRGRGRRPMLDVLAEMTSDAQRADYALRRIRALEGQIATVLASITEPARLMVYTQRPSLKVYGKKR